MSNQPRGIGRTSQRHAANSVVWRLPHLITSPNDIPTPVFASGAVVQNAASQLIGTYFTYVQTGGTTSVPARFIVSDSVAPGEIVRINGQCLGPIDGVVAVFDSNGRLPTALGGVKVTIGGVAAPRRPR